MDDVVFAEGTEPKIPVRVYVDETETKRNLQSWSMDLRYFPGNITETKNEHRFSIRESEEEEKSNNFGFFLSFVEKNTVKIYKTIPLKL